MKEKNLLSLINKYFQGETTLEEEKELRRGLNATTSDNPLVVEAKAVLSYVEMANRTKNVDVGRNKGKMEVKGAGWHRWAVAASVAILIAGVALPMFLSENKSVCATMIACRMDNSQETAFNLMSSQLEAVGYASDEVAEEVLDGLVLIAEY